jgi:DNA gyrase/topoisomerase IV subunit A
MRLRSLRKLEEFEIRKENDSLTKEKKELESLLKSEDRRWAAIAEEVQGNVYSRYANPNTDEFIAMMKGEGLLGPLLANLGVKKVSFKSPNEFKKTIATESKVFSIYAVGVVKGYKRETRSLVQAVVDYRDAPTLDGKGSASGAPAQLKGNEAFLSVLAPNPGGRLLYFRVE